MKWAKPYAVAAVLTAIVALGAFISYRNAAFMTRELDRAQAAVQAVRTGAPRVGHVMAAGLVLPSEESERYPFLRRRSIRDGSGAVRPLGGADAPAFDKMVFDAASRAEREGAITAFATDGQNLVVAALPTDQGVAIAITEPPAGPESFPLLVLLGLLVMGALVSAAGALVGGRAKPLGLAIGASGLAVPSYLWAGMVPAVIVLLIAIGISLLDHRGVLARCGQELRRGHVAYAFVAPTAIAMLVLVLAPFAIGLILGFYDHNHGEWTFVGLDNFIEILSGGGRSLSDPLNFWFTLGVTVAWTAANVVLHVVIGVGLALLLRQPWLRCKGIYRVLLILPWAIPNYITALIWNGMFQSEYGAVNALLSSMGLDKVSWFSDWATAFAANVCTNTWLGFPFMMIVALGALESIPVDMYEAAEVDGAGPWQRFVHITMPHLRPALGPAIVLGAIWTFNMFNVIYLVSEGQPGGSTDILVTEAYRWAFERGERYGLAAAYATIIFLILLLWTVFGTRVTRKDKK